MIQLHELDSICLIPSEVNQGHPGNRVDFTTVDALDVGGLGRSLPIFTSPMDSVVDSSKAEMYQGKGIRPIIPATESLEIRLNYCQYVFSAFSLSEVEECFLKNPVAGDSQFHICFDVGNGHDQQLLNLGREMNRTYGRRAILMGGNVGYPETYKEYALHGFDYMRVGISSGSLVDKDKYGFHYPMASLLEDIKNYRTSGGGKGLRYVRVIADGGISCPLDIVKAIALGADYVMVGRELARTIEAAGPVYKSQKNGAGQPEIVQVHAGPFIGKSGKEIRSEGLSRLYVGNTSDTVRMRRAGMTDEEEWENSLARYTVLDSCKNFVNVDCTLDEWLEEFKGCAYNAFMMTGSLKWDEFRKNVRYACI